MTTEAAIRELLNVQTYDNAWLFQVAEILHIDVEALSQNDWDLKHWNTKWGSIERVAVEGSEEIATAWHRPDRGPSLASTDKTENIRLAIYALLGELIDVLKNDNKGTYAEVEVTDFWQRARIKVNGREVVGVLAADAVLGTCTVAAKTAKGQLVVGKDGNIEEHIIRGSVEILYEKQNLSFF